ncbi:hypothetical protein ABTM60_20360, partial [Acinetobacter baumannii]
FHFQDRPNDVAAVEKQLGVEWLLLGSVQKPGNQLELSVQLVNVADGSTRWSQVYRRAPADLVDTESEIAVALANRLGVYRIG